MSISGISGGQFATLSSLLGTLGATTGSISGVGAGSVDGALIANLEAASSGVSAALQDLSGVLGSVIDTTA